MVKTIDYDLFKNDLCLLIKSDLSSVTFVSFE